MEVRAVDRRGIWRCAPSDKNESILSRLVLDESGTLVASTWHDQGQQWIKYWSVPVERCDEYGKCSANSNCDPSNIYKFECTCLPGHEPKSPRDWYLRDGSGGCVRKSGVSMCRNGEGFVTVAHVKVPDSPNARVNKNLSWKACQQECLRNCSCKAYAKADERWGGFGCVTWHGDLMDTSIVSNVGQDFGYMSPEYAMKGHFSVKSDVYSFGVILLEIVIGRKNSGYYHDKYPDANLVGHSSLLALWKTM
ncbi:hypothetical protein ACE6H2_028516 [Prunus campanulata]